MKKRIIVSLLLVALIANLFSFGVLADDEDGAAGDSAGTAVAISENDAEVPVDSGEAANDSSLPYTTTELSADFERVAGNDSLELYVNKAIAAIGVKDMTTGYIWYSSVPNDTYGREGLTKMQLDQLNSMLVLSYTVLNDNNSKTFSYPINNLSPKTSYENIPNGVRITYFVEDINLELSVEAVLEGDSLAVTVPKELIVEGKGTETKMQEYLDSINEFIVECRAAIDEVEEVGVSGNNKGIKNSRAKLDELQELTDGVTSLVGVAAVQSKASIILQDELQVYLCGGGGNEIGIFARTARSNKVSGKASYYNNLGDTIQSKLKRCASRFSLLTNIKVAGIVDVEIMPNMGAAGDYEDGYLFYPDGSGALTYNTPNHGQSTETYETAIYSDTSVNMAWENNRDSTGLKRMMLPVYGSKKNEQAFVAMIEDADTNASICLLPSGNTVNLNRINSKFTYRNVVQITSSSEYSTDSMASIFEKTAAEITPKIRYQFLNGTNYSADYSGMANAYRDQLLETSQLKKSSILNGKMPMALNFIAGTWKSMLFYQSYVSISSFEELGSVVDELGAAGVDNLIMYVDGWEKSEYPSTLKVPGAAGGAEGVRTLTEKLKNANGNLYLSVDLVDADTFNRGINESNLALGSNLRIYEFQKFWYKLFSPSYIRDNFSSTMNSVDKLGNPGIMLARMGNLLYSDFNDRYNTNRSDCADIWSELYATAQQQVSTAAEGGNKYLLNTADYLMDIPMASSGYTFSDESVPFYQMVVHGSIAYSAKPFNHFYDTDREKLQTIEYGAIPLYKLTYNDSSSLRKLFNDFTTPYVDCKDQIIEIYNEFNENFADLSDQYMVGHEKLTKDVARVTYQDGTIVYINYAETDYTTDDGITVPALDYTII